MERVWLLARFDLTDKEWAVIEPLLPTDVRGVPRVDDRKVLSGIFWRLRTGAPWADLPERYGPTPPATIAPSGGASAASESVSSEPCPKLTTGDLQMIDSSSVRVHQHAANGKKGVWKAGWAAPAAD
jgi:transposase